MASVSNDLVLTGPDAFYNDKLHVQNTGKTLSLRPLPPITYSCTLENRIYRIAKDTFSYFPPILIYRALHAFVGSLIVGKPYKGDIPLERLEKNGWKIKHITIEVDGSIIQTVIMGKPDTFNNGRWTIYSGGNREVTYGTLYNDAFTEGFLDNLNSNAILFNAPDVLAGALPNRTTYIKAYRAILQFLEEKLQAKEIICYSTSIGGGFLAQGLDSHELKHNVQYVCIKNRTFSTLRETVKEITGLWIAGFLVSLLGWNIDTAEASKRLKQKEIIIQVTNRETTALRPSLPRETIADDGIIYAKASLAYSLNEKDRNKCFLGLAKNHDHNSNLNREENLLLTDKINSLLSSMKSFGSEKTKINQYFRNLFLQVTNIFKALSSTISSSIFSFMDLFFTKK